ncbi:MAG: protein-disulfide reductase DsbD family protein [Beijerinckiaceae bacterium]|nr:protein-disulfide reductase DsbD family protein [Beijerinckiaceae bacterium]
MNKTRSVVTESFLATEGAASYIKCMIFPFFRTFTALSGVVAAIALLLAAEPARAQQKSEPGASTWSPSPKSRARLVSAGPLENGVYRAGVEIALDGNALTYWRNPGDAGVPPEFDFTGSTNLAKTEIAYPAPERHDEDGSEVFGWRRSVIFPLQIAPVDPAKPVIVTLALRYAACEKICIPSDGRMEFTFAPKAPGSPQAERIARWAMLVPRPAAQAGATFALENIAGSPKPRWRVSVSPSEAGSDLFAEGEDGWFFDTRVVAGGGFKLALAERPTGSANVTSVRLTLRLASGAVEFETKLDAGEATP